MAAFVFHNQPAFYECGRGIGLELLGKRLPAFGCVADAVAFGNFGRKPAFLGIGLSLRRGLKLAGIEGGGGLEGGFQRLLLFFACGTRFGRLVQAASPQQNTP